MEPTQITRRPRKVRNTRTGAIGYAVKYGTADFGGIRYVVCPTREDALDCCVSDTPKYHPDFQGNSVAPVLSDWHPA